MGWDRVGNGLDETGCENGFTPTGFSVLFFCFLNYYFSSSLFLRSSVSPNLFSFLFSFFFLFFFTEFFFSSDRRLEPALPCRLYRVLLGFTGFYRVLLGFTGFYWVLPSFT